MPEKRALILIADGTEEMEAIITADVLVRGGIKVTLAKVSASDAPTTSPVEDDITPVKGSRGLFLVPNINLAAIPSPKENPSSHYDILIIPGGAPGTEVMRTSSLVKEWVSFYFQSMESSTFGRQQDDSSSLSVEKLWVASICAGPLVLLEAKAYGDLWITSHPSVKDKLRDFYKYEDEKRVVVQEAERLITSRGPGTTFEFALKIVEKLMGQKVVDEIRPPLMLPPL